jgi:hypothetical protein
MDITDLHEFRYWFGDPRLCLLEFLQSVSKNVTTYTANFGKKDFIFFKKPKRKDPKSEFIIPRAVRKSIKTHFLNTKKGLIVLPIMIKSKGDTHVNYIVYNAYTHELERIDLKKYHLHGINVKRFYTKLKESNFRDFIETLDEDVELLDEHDVPLHFMAKFPEKNIKQIFPIYILTYIALRAKYPRYYSHTIQSMLLKTEFKIFEKYWKQYQKISQNMQSKKCRSDQVLRYGTNNCIYTSSKNSMKLLVEQPIKSCAESKQFNIVTRRCVNPKTIKKVNILLDQISSVKISSKTKLAHIASALNLLPAVNFVLSKYPYAFLVLPKNAIDKRTSSLTWFWNRKEGKHDFNVPNGLLPVWKEGLADQRIRFMVILLSLTSSLGGAHANCLIYDKKHNEIERFDAVSVTHESYHHVELDEHLQAWFNTFAPPNMKYFKPIDYCPVKLAFQRKELHEVGYDDSHGNCAVWRLWYIDLRLNNPHLTRKEVIKMAMHRLNEYGAFQKFIKSYQAYVLQNISRQSSKKSAASPAAPTVSVALGTPETSKPALQ